MPNKGDRIGCGAISLTKERERPLEKINVTLYGERNGFFMIDATRALAALPKRMKRLPPWCWLTCLTATSSW